MLLLLQLVVCSTLSRAIETSVGAFGATRKDRRSKNSSGNVQERVLMVEQGRIANKQSSHQEIVASEASPPVLALEECRERLGEYAEKRPKIHFPMLCNIS